MFLSYALGVIVIAWVLIRQTRIRPVPRTPQVRMPIVLGVLGLFELSAYTSDHHVAGSAYLWVGATLLVGAVIMGALRALTVKVWTSTHWVVRQGTAVTMVLWVISLAAHFLADAGNGNTGAAHLESASLLLYLGLTLGVQNVIVHRRAMPLWNQLGPDAGRRMQMNFSQGPNAFFGTIFTNVGTDQYGPAPQASADPNIIDAEVVEDGDGRPELPRSS